jgi:hypothetical protein
MILCARAPALGAGQAKSTKLSRGHFPDGEGNARGGLRRFCDLGGQEDARKTELKMLASLPAKMSA